MGLSVSLHCMILYVDIFNVVFNISALSFDQWLVVLKFSLPVLLVDEALKFIARNYTDAIGLSKWSTYKCRTIQNLLWSGLETAESTELCVPNVNNWNSVGHQDPPDQLFLLLPNILVELTGFPTPIYAFFLF